MQDIYSQDFGDGDGNQYTQIVFKRELTQAQKATLDTIMANDPCAVPVPTGTAMTIKDLWAMRDWFRQRIGQEFTFWFEEEKAGQDRYIHLHFPKTLTTQERNKVKSEYQGMIE